VIQIFISHISRIFSKVYCNSIVVTIKKVPIFYHLLLHGAVPNIAAIENRNWLLYRHYARHEYSACKLLIEQELMKSDGHEYANYLKVR
jgi:hypothetical protein